MASAKIRIKVGEVEVEYEGDAAFLDKDLMKMVQELQKVAPVSAPPKDNPNKNTGSTGSAGSAGGSGGGSGSNPSLTTRAIATKLGLSGSRGLAKAAVIHLAIIKGMSTFKRSEINDAMRSATGIYNASMTGNLSPSIQKLLSDDVLVETGTETYSMTPQAEQTTKASLGIG